MSRLKIIYLKKIIYSLKKFFKNSMSVPKLKKITLNTGVGNYSNDKKIINNIMNDLESISGQKPLIIKSKKSISSFKARKGNIAGIKVTLRGDKMYEFLDRLISITIPRIRDFRGLKITSFDGMGNYNMGIKEQVSFVEINYEKVNIIYGLNISITTTAKKDEDGSLLLKSFNFPLKTLL